MEVVTDLFYIFLYFDIHLNQTDYWKKKYRLFLLDGYNILITFLKKEYICFK